jgi:hypothetical protein
MLAARSREKSEGWDRVPRLHHGTVTPTHKDTMQTVSVLLSAWAAASAATLLLVLSTRPIHGLVTRHCAVSQHSGLSQNDVPPKEE